MLILFVVTLLVGAMLNHLIGQLVKNTGLTGMDRFLGMGFGMARGVIIVIALLVFLPPASARTTAWEHSRLIPRFIAIEHWFHGVAEDATHYFHLSNEKQ